MFIFRRSCGNLGVMSALLACCVAGPAAGDELRYLPDGVNYINLLDVSTIRRSKTFAALLKAKVAIVQDIEKDLVNDFGMSPDNVERVSIGAVLPTANDLTEPPYVTVVTTRKPIVAPTSRKPGRSSRISGKRTSRSSKSRLAISRSTARCTRTIPAFLIGRAIRKQHKRSKAKHFAWSKKMS
jgi:hypothetical protein